MIFFSGCLKNLNTAPIAQFHITDTTEFRYKNSVTNNLYLPKNISVCVLDKTDLFPNTKKLLKEFLILDWKNHAIVKDNCVGVDFYLRLNITEDLIYKERDNKGYFSALKVNIYQRKDKKIVADFTIKNAKWTMHNTDKYTQGII
jgi:hypothetical protein